jgi:microcystin-dependent protein
MTYADNYNIRTTSVKFNDVGDALDGLITRNYAGLTTGTSTTYIATPTPAWDAYTTSGLIVIIPHVSNSGASTINISGLGAKDLRIGGAAISAGVLQQNIPTIIAYTGSVFEILLQNVSIPIGQISAFAGSSAPVGWLMCDGSSQSTTGAYAALYGVIGYTYGGSGASFNLPDLLRRAPVGKGGSDTLGGNDGVAYASRSMSHTHTISHTHNIANHQHTVPAHYHTNTSNSLSVDISHNHSPSAVTGTVGGSDGTHDHDLRQEAGGGGTADGSAANIITLVASTVSAFRNSNNHYTGGGHGHSHSLIASGQVLGSNIKYVSGTVGTGVNGDVAFSTNAGEGGVGTSSQTGTTSGPNTQQHLFVNYIIKF